MLFEGRFQYPILGIYLDARPLFPLNNPEDFPEIGLVLRCRSLVMRCRSFFYNCGTGQRHPIPIFFHCVLCLLSHKSIQSPTQIPPPGMNWKDRLLN